MTSSICLFSVPMNESGFYFSSQAFFGVYDGHGGTAAAEFAAENLDEYVMGEVAKREEDDGGGYEHAVRTGYLRTDREFLEKQGAGGACCVTAVINNGDLVVSNAGDCRAVISRGGDAEALTSDHRPSREDERARIESLVRLLPRSTDHEKRLNRW